MKIFELQLIFGNNCSRHSIQLLLQSKYITTEHNLAVHFCEHVIVNFLEAAVSVHIPAQIIRSWGLKVDHDGINWMLPLQVFQLQLQVTDLIYFR